ncbi:hypothetical protein AB0N29_19665 [Nocardioides sp. NPDC092400]|uniref:hypothetical protein n=1 Tax=Nocardioides sp. NPDC092400 TaxID=3155196 RepID=UPI0034130ABC
MARYARRDLTPDLDDFSFEAAVARLHALDKRHAIIPTDAKAKIDTVIDALRDAARDLGLVRLTDIVEHRVKIIAATSGLPSKHHHEYLPEAKAEPLHLHRNVLLAITLASLCGRDGDIRKVTDLFPSYKRRTRQTKRPHTDDEMLMLRLFALHQSTGDKNNRRASAVFAMCDAGVAPVETTQVYIEDLVLPEGGNNTEALVEAPGIHGLTGRVLALDKFATTLMCRYVDAADRAGNGVRLTYRPRDAYAKETAQSSVDGIMKRMREAVGLSTRQETSASSVWKWRAAHTHRTLGTRAALEVSGIGSSIELYDTIHLDTTTRATATHTKKPDTFDLDD